MNELIRDTANVAAALLKNSKSIHIDALSPIHWFSLRYYVKTTGEVIYFCPKSRQVSFEGTVRLFDGDGRLLIDEEPAEVKLLDGLLSAIM